AAGALFSCSTKLGLPNAASPTVTCAIVGHTGHAPAPQTPPIDVAKLGITSRPTNGSPKPFVQQYSETTEHVTGLTRSASITLPSVTHTRIHGAPARPKAHSSTPAPVSGPSPAVTVHSGTGW